jgi:hypothetical protein
MELDGGQFRPGGFMKRVTLAVFTVAFLAAMAWPVSQAIGAATGVREPAVCREMTAAKMLEHPALAGEWAQALRSSAPDEVARVRALIEQIRAAHGCSGELALPAFPSPAPDAGALPPGHPPVPGRGLPRGHPPVQSSPRSLQLFHEREIVTI